MSEDATKPNGGNDGRRELFVGTPKEIEAWIRRYFEIIRIYLEVSSGEVPEEFERTLWAIDVSASGGFDRLAKDEVRKDLRVYADEMALERELFRLLTDMSNDDPSDGGGEPVE